MPRDEEARKKYLEEYLKRPEVIARRREIDKKYRKSPKGKEAKKRYKQKYNKSPKGIEANKKRRRKDALSWKYKISEEEYNKILEKQVGLCAICGSDSPRRKGSKNFAVDHNHTTMEVRGLLCHPCNVMIGLAKDNIEVLETAIRYLKNSK